MLLLIVTGLCLIAFGGNDCGLNRLHPSAITADSEYSSSYPVENLIDGSYSTYWYSGSGDTNDYVYIDFSNDVDIKHIMIREGTYAVHYISVSDPLNTKSYTNLDDTEDYKIYNFWFPEFITDRVRIYFSGSSGSYLTVSDVSFWGCNMTSTAPTAAPTVSPSQMPTNSTPTVEPTLYPSVSPTQVPTMSSVEPSISPTPIPTEKTVEPSISPTPIPTEKTIDSNDDFTIAIGVAELLGVVLFFLLGFVIFLCIKLHITKKKSQLLRLTQETHELKDNL